MRGFGFSFDAPVLASVDVWALLLSAAAVIAMFRFKVGMIPTLAACSAAGLVLHSSGRFREEQRGVQAGTETSGAGPGASASSMSSSGPSRPRASAPAASARFCATLRSSLRSRLRSLPSKPSSSSALDLVPQALDRGRLGEPVRRQPDAHDARVVRLRLPLDEADGGEPRDGLGGRRRTHPKDRRRARPWSSAPARRAPAAPAPDRRTARGRRACRPCGRDAAARPGPGPSRRSSRPDASSAVRSPRSARRSSRKCTMARGGEASMTVRA